MTSLQDQYADLFRGGLAAEVDMITATIKGAERLRTHQLEIINRVLTENAGLAEQIKNMKGLDGLMAAYSTLVGNQFKNMVAYWSGVQQVASENQVALQQRGQAQMTELQRHLASSLEAVVNGGPESMVEVVKKTVGANSAGYGMLSQAAEVMARLAAAQVATAEAGIRSATATTKRKMN